MKNVCMWIEKHNLPANTTVPHRVSAYIPERYESRCRHPRLVRKNFRS